MNKSDTNPRICIGVSSCLLGQAVRYDGGHKRDAYINDTLVDYFEFVPVCPEVAIGLGTPRDPIRLVGDPATPCAVGVRSKDMDVTGRLERYADKQANKLKGLSGYIFKRGSPSCGMERVKVYGENGQSTKTGQGIYARELMRRYPQLPAEEEGRLGDPVLRENFIQRIFIYHDWQKLKRRKLNAKRLVAFHSGLKFVLLAHNQAAYKRLGQMVARAGKEEISTLTHNYELEMMTALKRRATRKQHTNVLQHLAGYLKRDLDAGDKEELGDTIDSYRCGELPLIVPLTLLRHHFRRHPNPYVARQRYLEPHPRELMLRNAL